MLITVLSAASLTINYYNIIYYIPTHILMSTSVVPLPSIGVRLIRSALLPIPETFWQSDGGINGIEWNGIGVVNINKRPWTNPHHPHSYLQIIIKRYGKVRFMVKIYKSYLVSST